MIIERAGVVFMCAAGLTACSTTPEPLPGDPPLDRPIVHAVCVHVTCEGPEVDTWGTAEEWGLDVVAVLREAFRGTKLIFDNAAADPLVADPDVSLHIRVSPSVGREPEVESSTAILEVLAYITIPLLPIWIRDVHKDPGVNLRVTLSSEADGKPIGEKPMELPAPRLLTSFVERVPLFSWKTLGAILVPPFVFEGDDRSEHMESSMGMRVRQLAGGEIAKALQAIAIDPTGLLRDIRVRRSSKGPELEFLVDQDVRALSIRFGKRTGEPWITETLAIGRKGPVPLKYPLPAEENIVRIEVISFETPDVRRCYTIVIDETSEVQSTS